MDKEDVVHIFDGILVNHKKDEIIPVATMLMDLEIAILSQTEKDISYDIVYMRNLIKGYKWSYLQNRSRVADVENKLIVIRKKGGWIHWEFGIDIYTLY